jgi:curved DNA-binding protein CbpA
MNNYEILEIPKGSDVVLVKAAYKKLVKRYHPDKTGGEEETNGLL